MGPLVLTFILWSGASACFAGFGLWQKIRDDRDREARRVIVGIERIKTQPSEPPDDDELIGARPVLIARSPLADTSALDRAELAGIVAYKTTAAAQRRPAGAHRAVGPRDPRRRGWRRDTEMFAAIVEAESGEELTAVGPREKALRCTRTDGMPVLTAAGAVR